MKLSHLTFSFLLGMASLHAEALKSDLYQKANQSYAAKSYQEAYPLYEQLNDQFPDSPEINFLVGRCALELKLYDEAVAAFDRVLILNPQHNRTRLELARLYTEIGQYDLAQTELDTVLSGQLPSEVRDIVLTFKSNIDKRLSRHTFNGVIVMGGGYDSNANNDIGNKAFLVPSFNLWLDGKEEVSSTSIFATSVLNFGYDFGDRGGWSIENSVVGYTVANAKERQNNLSLISLSASPTWFDQDYRLQFPLTYDRVYMDDKGYMYNLSGGARISYLLDTTSQLSGGYTYKRGYFDTDSALDVSSHSFSASYKKAFGENPIIIAINTSYSINNELEGSRTDVTSHGYGYGAEISKTFPYQINGAFVYSVGSTFYEETDVTFGTMRHDTRKNYEIRLSKFIQNNVSVNAIASYIENDSNQAPFEYDKMTFQLNGAFSF
jgi:hypothetical protein